MKGRMAVVLQMRFLQERARPEAMSERRAAYVVTGKEVMVGTRRGIVEKIYPSGLVLVRLEHGPWIGPPAYLSECEEVCESLEIDEQSLPHGLGCPRKAEPYRLPVKNH
jgi:hypothetical protein